MNLSERWKVPKGDIRLRRTFGSGAVHRPTTAATLTGRTAQQSAFRAKHPVMIAQPCLRYYARFRAGAMGGVQVALERCKRLPAVAEISVARRAARHGTVDPGRRRNSEFHGGQRGHAAIPEPD